MAFINPLNAAGPLARATWSTLMGTTIPKWVYPAFGAAAVAPIAGYEMEQMRRIKEQRKAQAMKAAMAVNQELGPPGSLLNTIRVNQLGNMKSQAKATSNVPSVNKPTSTFRQAADTVDSGDGDEGDGAGVDLPTNEFATN